MMRSLMRKAINRSPTLFSLRNRMAMWPATLAGPEQSGRRSWSQHGEDERLVQELRDLLLTGYYVDVGANHPAVLSNTYRLYCLGMRGICVEPNALLARLHERYRPGDQMVSAAVGDQDGLLTFYEMSYHAFNTFSPEDMQNYISRGMQLVHQSLKPIFRLSTILRSCAPPGKTFALLSVDTEGFDEKVLRSNDWNQFHPRYVLAEGNTPEATAGTGGYLRELGYELIGTYGVNGLYRSPEPVRKSIS